VKPTFLTVPRRARYFSLGPAGPEAREVWIVLHGYAQLAERFLRWFRPIDDGHRWIVAPEALSRFYLETTLKGSHGRVTGATWLTREAREADLEDHLGYLDRLLDHVQGRVGRIPLTVLGFSQGAAMAARWLLQRPVPVSRVVLWGTPLPADVDPVELGGRLQGIPVWLVAGARDAYAPAEAIGAAAAGLAAGGASVTTHRYPGGHRVEPEPLLAIREATSSA
jgi:predicted esterase